MKCIRELIIEESLGLFRLKIFWVHLWKWLPTTVVSLNRTILNKAAQGLIQKILPSNYSCLSLSAVWYTSLNAETPLLFRPFVCYRQLEKHRICTQRGPSWALKQKPSCCEGDSANHWLIPVMNLKKRKKAPWTQLLLIYSLDLKTCAKCLSVYHIIFKALQCFSVWDFG